MWGRETEIQKREKSSERRWEASRRRVEGRLLLSFHGTWCCFEGEEGVCGTPSLCQSPSPRGLKPMVNLGSVTSITKMPSPREGPRQPWGAPVRSLLS